MIEHPFLNAEGRQVFVVDVIAAERLGATEGLLGAGDVLAVC